MSGDRVDVGVGDVGRDVEHHLDLGGLGVEVALELEALAGRELPLELGHRPLEQAAVEVVADVGDVSALLGAQHVARPADLEVAHGDLKAGAQVAELLQRAQPAAGEVADLALLGEHQVAVGLDARAADASAELVHLAQPVMVGAVEEQGVGARDVEPVLDEGRGHQHVGVVLHEGQHALLDLVLGQLAVDDEHPRPGHPLAHLVGEAVDGPHPVVDEVDLAFAGQLALDRALEQLRAARHDLGLDRRAPGRRGVEDRDVPRAREGHVQGPRDRSGGEGQEVDPVAQRLEALLVGHPEALLLVDHHQAEVA